MKPTKIKISDFMMETAIEAAKLKGVELAPGEGYTRTNDGGWVLSWDVPRDDEDAGRFCVVDYRGNAKKNLFQAPDPEGFAIAQKIVELWNAQ